MLHTRRNSGILVRGDHQDPRALHEPEQAAECLVKKSGIADADNLVDQQNLRVADGGDGKCKRIIMPLEYVRTEL